MKKIFLSMLVVALCITSFGQTEKNGPSIKFDKTMHNFGEILAGSNSVTHDFTFTNDGDEPLMITNCKATCGCTVPKWTKEPVMPGQTGTVSVTYNSTKNATTNPFGKTVHVFVNINDPVTNKPKDIGLTIKGHVVKELSSSSIAELGTEVIDLGEFKKNKKIETSFIVKNAGNKAFNIIEVTCGSPNVTVDGFEAVVPQAGQTIIELVVNTQNICEKGESVKFPVIVKTDADTNKELQITVVGTRIK